MWTITTLFVLAFVMLALGAKPDLVDVVENYEYVQLSTSDLVQRDLEGHSLIMEFSFQAHGHWFDLSLTRHEDPEGSTLPKTLTVVVDGEQTHDYVTPTFYRSTDRAMIRSAEGTTSMDARIMVDSRGGFWGNIDSETSNFRIIPARLYRLKPEHEDLKRKRANLDNVDFVIYSTAQRKRLLLESSGSCVLKQGGSMDVHEFDTKREQIERNHLALSKRDRQPPLDPPPSPCPNDNKPSLPIAIVLDYRVSEHFDDDTSDMVDYFSDIMDEADTVYKDQLSLRLFLAKLIIEKSKTKDDESPKWNRECKEIPKCDCESTLGDLTDIWNQYYEFADWRRKNENHAIGHYQLFTSHRSKYDDTCDDSSILGLAEVGGVCETGLFSRDSRGLYQGSLGTAITRFSGDKDQDLIVFMHELAHNAGAYHDGSSTGGPCYGCRCTPEHIMNPFVSDDQRKEFSKCSQRYMCHMVNLGMTGYSYPEEVFGKIWPGAEKRDYDPYNVNLSGEVPGCMGRIDIFDRNTQEIMEQNVLDDCRESVRIRILGARSTHTHIVVKNVDSGETLDRIKLTKFGQIYMDFDAETYLRKGKKVRLKFIMELNGDEWVKSKYNVRLCRPKDVCSKKRFNAKRPMFGSEATEFGLKFLGKNPRPLEFPHKMWVEKVRDDKWKFYHGFYIRTNNGWYTDETTIKWTKLHLILRTDFTRPWNIEHMEFGRLARINADKVPGATIGEWMNVKTKMNLRKKYDWKTVPDFYVLFASPGRDSSAAKRAVLRSLKLTVKYCVPGSFD